MKMAKALTLLIACGLASAHQAWGNGQPVPVASASMRASASSNLDQVTLIAAPQVLHFGSFSFSGMTYNGNYSGPLIKVKPGDTLRVHLVNHLTQITNVHFHGILASPLSHGDNMMTQVAPGQSFDYEIKIPLHQTPGLYWYHAHVHHQASDDVNAGLAGPLLVEGFPAKYYKSPEQQEEVMVLKEFETDGRREANFPNLVHNNILTINGQIRTALTMRTGERQLWQVGNLSANRAFQLKIDGHAFTIVGHDGVPLLHPLSVDTLDIDAASRYTVFIDTPVAGDFAIRGSDDDGDGRAGDRRGSRRRRRDASDGSESSGVVLGALHVGPSAVTGAAPPIVFTGSPGKLPPDLTHVHIDAARLFVFGQEGRKYTINGNTFDPMRVDTRVPLGHIEEWTIRNDTNDVHVFHIHQVTFQVMSVNGQSQAFNGAVDTVRVLPGSSVTVRIAFTHPEIVGRFMYHCHILEHEDGGMMGQIEVYDPRKQASQSEGIMPLMSM